MITLFDYQLPAVSKMIEWGDSDPSIANTLVAPMASGKTLMACYAINQQYLAGKRVWVIVNRIELLEQWHTELLRINPDIPRKDIGFISGDRTPVYYKPIQFVQIQTLTRRFNRVNDENAPHIIYLDEAHETAFQRVTTTLKNRWSHVKQINLTATPVRHGKSPVQYRDLFPVDTWHHVISAKELIANGRWKTPQWITASDELAIETSQRFSGMKMSGGEYDDTSQSAVMIDLLPSHLKEWAYHGGDAHSCIWFCVDVKHCEATVAALKSLGRSAEIVTGETDPGVRKDSVDRFKRGEITDLVNCQCLTTGFDAPIASCAVWLRRTMSVGLFCQMAGRVLRKFDGAITGYLMDLAGNLALHPFPEEIDWWEFDPCKKIFRDPFMVMCQNCNYRHDAIPTPLHPTDLRVRFQIGMGCFADDTQPSIDSNLVCHCCGEKLYGNREQITQYGEWLIACGKAKAMGKRPPSYSGVSAGISIGRAGDQHFPLTIRDMYSLGIWKFSEGKKERNRNADRSNEYNELRIKLSRNMAGKELRDLRFSLLTEAQKRFVNATPVAKLMSIPVNGDRYRAAIAYAYINDKSPTWCWSYWRDDSPIPKIEIEKALNSLMNCEQSIGLIEGWLDHWIEQNTDQRKKGVCREFRKCLDRILNTKGKVAA